LTKNVVSNVSAYVVSIILSFIIAPITVHTLGDARYGAWTLVSELIGYYSLLDLGIRGAVTYYIAKTRAEADEASERSTLATAFWLLCASGAVVLVVGIMLTYAFPHLLKAEELTNILEVQRTFLIMSLLIAVTLPMETFSAVLGGLQRFDLDSIADISSRILSGIGFYISLKSGWGLIGLALVLAITRVIYWCLTVTFVCKALGGIYLQPSTFSMERVKAITSYGSRNLVTLLSQLIIRRLDLIVTTFFVGVSFVTYYSLGGTLAFYATTFCSSIVFVFTPRFTDLYSRSAHDELEKLYISSTRMVGMPTVGLVVGILLFSHWFLRLWVGAKYVSGPWMYRSDVVSCILIAGYLPRLLHGTSWQLLAATARVRFLMWLNLGEAIANFTLSVILVHYFRLAGIAIGTLVPMLVSYLIIMPVFVARTFKIPYGRIVKKAFAAPIAIGLATAIIGGVTISLKPPLSWAWFVVDTLFVALCGISLSWFTGLSRDERRQFLLRFGISSEGLEEASWNAEQEAIK
jgi:O-antigen/teichoic acid export membrane protein